MRFTPALVLACFAATATAEPQKISFTRVFPNPGQLSLSIAAADGSQEHPLFAKPALDYDAVWSPDGATIVFTSERAGSADLYRVKPDGTDVKQLTFTHGNDAHMGWSPDGEFIVFASSRMGFKDEVIYTDAPQPYGEIFMMRSDGAGVQPLTDNQWEDGTPAWQPTGRAWAKP